MTAVTRKLVCFASLTWLTVVSSSVAWADEVSPLTNSGVVIGQSEIYRLRTDLPEKTVRRADWLGGDIIQSVVYQNRLYLIGSQEGRQQLWQTSEGLRISPVPEVGTSAEFAAKISGDRLWIYRRNTEVNLLSFDGQTWQSYRSPAENRQALERIYQTANGSWHMLVQRVDQLESWISQGEDFALDQSYTCQLNQLISSDSPAALCTDGRVINLTDNDVLEGGVPNWLSENADLTAWLTASSTNVSLWHSGELRTIELPLTAQKIFLSGKRMVLTGSFGISELLWQLPDPQLVSVTPNNSAVVVATEEGYAISESVGLARLSSQPASWSTVGAVGTFNGATRVKSGWLVYKQGTSGGLTQLAPDGQSFHRVNHPWSQTTSPVRAVWLSPVENWLLVRTSSGNGNLNLYRSGNLENWTRITLPSSTTYALPIQQARSLPASSLVWLQGVMTVPANVVGGETGYLEDETGGIQIFLDSSQGQLPTTPNLLASLEGVVSSSQAKRINLAGPQDLQLGSAIDWPWPSTKLDELALRLGRTGQLEGKISKLETDWLTLSHDQTEVKVHFASAKSRFQLGDIISLPVVADYNASSGHNEAWWLGVDEQLLYRPAPDQPTTTNGNQTSTDSAVVVSARVTQKSPTSSNQAAPVKLPSASKATIVKASTTKNNPSPKPAAPIPALPGILGFLAGASTMTGRRLSNILG